MTTEQTFDWRKGVPALRINPELSAPIILEHNHPEYLTKNARVFGCPGCSIAVPDGALLFESWIEPSVEVMSQADAGAREPEIAAFDA